MCQQTYTFQFPLYLIRPFVVSLLHSHNLCYTTLPLLPPGREERCITTQIMAVRQTRSWPVGRTLCKPPCYTSYTLSFVPHKKLNLTLLHTFQLCPWVPPRPNECLNEPIAKSAAITYHCTKEKWRPISSEWIFFTTRVLGQCCFISRQFYRTAQPLEYYRQFLGRSSCKLQLIKVTSGLGKVQFCQTSMFWSCRNRMFDQMAVHFWNSEKRS